MHKQLIFIFAFLFTLAAQAKTSTEMKKDYSDFRKQYLILITSSPSKNEFVKYFNNQQAKLNNQYEAFVVKEGQQLTAEGNQMGLDLELLEPLKMLAESNLSPETCEEAYHSNDLNAMADVPAAKTIGILIDKLCK